MTGIEANTKRCRVEPLRTLWSAREVEVVFCPCVAGVPARQQQRLFLNIQHPGENGTVEDPESHWPDGPGRMPRSSLIAVSREDGGVIEA